MRRKCQGRLTVHTKSEGFGYLRAHRYAFAFSAGSIRWKPFREPFLFLFAGREVRLPSRGRALLAWGSGDRLVLFFLRLLFLPIASLFASGHVSLLWLTTGYHLRATFRNWPMLDMPMRDSDCPLSTCPPTNSILDVSAILIFSPSSIACAPRRFISSTPCDAVSVQERAFQRSPPCAWQSWRHAREPAPHLPHQLSLKAPAA